MVRRARPVRPPAPEPTSAIELFRVRATSLADGARTVLARLFGVGDPTAPDSNQEQIEESEVLFPIGFIARPKITGYVEAVIVRDGDETHIISFNRKDGAALSASDADEGETLIYSDAEPKASITLRKTGKIEIRCKAGQNIEIFADGQSATSPVAHEGSQTSGHLHAAGTLVAGPYAVTGATASATDTVATGQGAQRVRVPTS